MHKTIVTKLSLALSSFSSLAFEIENAFDSVFTSLNEPSSFRFSIFCHGLTSLGAIRSSFALSASGPSEMTL